MPPSIPSLARHHAIPAKPRTRPLCRQNAEGRSVRRRQRRHNHRRHRHAASSASMHPASSSQLRAFASSSAEIWPDPISAIPIDDCKTRPLICARAVVERRLTARPNLHARRHPKTFTISAMQRTTRSAESCHTFTRAFPFLHFRAAISGKSNREQVWEGGAAGCQRDRPVYCPTIGSQLKARSADKSPQRRSVSTAFNQLKILNPIHPA